MTTVLHAGVAVLDFIFQVDKFPDTADKYRAQDATIVNGGNAANAAIAVSRMGGRAMLAARLGDDAVADLILAGLNRNRVDHSLVRRFENARSSFSSIFVDPAGERQIMNFRDTSITMAPDWLEHSLPDHFDVALGETRWPLGGRAIMQAARDRGLPGIMDGEVPVYEGEEALHLATHVAFSARGVMEFSGESDIAAGALSAARKLPGRVYATNGGHGVVSVENGKAVLHPTFAIQAVDTLGAGDVWHAAFALQVAEHANNEDAIRFANAAAAIKCTRTGGGSGAPTRTEIMEFLEQNV